MGHQFIKQPNGKFAIWSSIVTDFIAFDCTQDEVVQMEVEDAVAEITTRAREKLKKVERGEPAYYQFTMTWDEALKRRDEQHGKDGREFDDQGNPLPHFVVEAWVDGGPAGSIEAYWAPGNVEGTSKLWGVSLKDEWTDWTGDPRKAKSFSTKEEAEKEIVLIKEQKKEWSSNMQVLEIKR